ncbi:MAG: SRPBCC family protein [Muribaculaceae bacterium]|nr:SRPBCC family protein [Muribaculaceae bacterium]
MTTIKSDKATVSAPAEKVFDKLSNLENLKSLLEAVPRDKIPEDKREMMDKLQITADTISIPAGPVGEIRLRVTDRLPHSLIRLAGEGAPVPMDMQLEIEPDGADKCEVQVAVNLEIPAMLKPMVSGPLKKIANQFVQVLSAIPFN